MNTKNELNRRQWIAASSGIVIASCLPSNSLANQDESKQLKFLTTSPRNGEPALNDLVQSWITPTKFFYVRSHAPNPAINPNQFRIRVEGKVRKPLELRLEQLARFKRHDTTATLTCAGNRRAEFNAERKVGGVQWGSGAIGNANWSGFALADVLREAEVVEGAKHVWFEGLDQIERKNGVIPFGASIPIEKAMINDGQSAPLLSDQMNGEALTPDHGFPLRTVVPGYIGARSVKWLGKIVVSDCPSPNHYVATAYKIVRDQTAMSWNEAGPIYRFPVNAAVCTPESQSQVDVGKHTVTGYALPTGIAGSVIRVVNVSVDGGRSWKEAKIQNSQSEFCWSLWSVQVDIEPTTTEILVKAEDTSGGFMPSRVPWNAKGYLQNSWYRQRLKVNQ